MANKGKNTNGNEFFVTLKDEVGIPGSGRHTVFGEIVEGFDVLDKIFGVRVIPDNIDMPVGKIEIVSGEVVEEDKIIGG